MDDVRVVGPDAESPRFRVLCAYLGRTAWLARRSEGTYRAPHSQVSCVHDKPLLALVLYRSVPVPA